MEEKLLQNCLQNSGVLRSNTFKKVLYLPQGKTLLFHGDQNQHALGEVRKKNCAVNPEKGNSLGYWCINTRE